ncbi:MAG: hypothetical protein RLO17_24760 [Cyclobacteriaceae bacterium]|jgi:hypothetical protein|tara:strand:+ start:4902 stop:5111 length:210 start_codon:yes stop_codon:yes gene_type:complete
MEYHIDVIVEHDSMVETVYKIITNENIMSEKILSFQFIEDLIGDYDYSIEPQEIEANLFKLKIHKKPLE